MGQDIAFHACFDFQFEPSWFLAYHHHEFHELIFVLDGVLRLEAGTLVLTAHPGSFITIPKETWHMSSSYGDSGLKFTALSWNGGSALLNLQDISLSTDHRGRIRTQLMWILEHYPQQTNKDREVLNALAYLTVQEMGRLQEIGPNDLFIQVRTFVRNHLHERITLDDLAGLTCMSKYHFARTFRRLSGQTPMQCVNDCRLDIAYDMLANTDCTVENAAIQVGFVDASHLTRHFRKRFGCTPGALRKRGSAKYSIFGHDRGGYVAYPT